MKEVQALIDVSQHPNIVRFIGALGEGDGDGVDGPAPHRDGVLPPPCLCPWPCPCPSGVCMDPPRIVTEYYPLGSLFFIIAKARESDHNVIQQLSWARFVPTRGDTFMWADHQVPSFFNLGVGYNQGPADML